MSERDYTEGLTDGLAGKPPEFDRLALGANSLNDYERGYIASGTRVDTDA